MGLSAYTFLPLAYSFSDLAPAMSEATMRFHHDVIHGAYLAACNELLVPYPALAALTIEQVLADPQRLPAEIREKFLVNGGGHANHQFMWKILGARRGTQPRTALGAKINEAFGGLESFKAKFKSAALGLAGEGWAFLSLAAPRTSALEIVVLSANGNVLELRKPGILICDLWQHAYCDDHNGDRAAWIDNYLNIVDWSQCSLRYDRLVAGLPVP